MHPSIHVQVNHGRQANTYDVSRQRERGVTVSGNYSRVRADLALPSNEDEYQSRYLTRAGSSRKARFIIETASGTCTLGTARRSPSQRQRRRTERNGAVLRVDVGVNQIAVTSTARFFSAGKLNHARRGFESTRRDLQDCETQSAHRTL
ncbi:MAG: hypothetical protein J07HQX50_01061 [Haloquadratum sp. J07HQX50]|nr:MAG: hypothetical protein J07HQX50_01061 [Haloquadratum sp. J07HQX50]